MIKANGLSMLPLIRPGDSILVQPLSIREIHRIKKNDLILFQKENRLICHRIIGIVRLRDKTILIEKGDNTSRVGLVKEDQILGKAIKIGNIDHPFSPPPDNHRHWLYLLIRDRVFHLFDRILSFVKEK